MAKTTQIARDVQSWKAGGEYIAYLDKRDVLFLARVGGNERPERIDQSVAEYQIAGKTLVFQTTDGTLYFRPLE